MIAFSKGYFAFFIEISSAVQETFNNEKNEILSEYRLPILSNDKNNDSEGFYCYAQGNTHSVS